MTHNFYDASNDEMVLNKNFNGKLYRVYTDQDFK